MLRPAAALPELAPPELTPCCRIRPPGWKPPTAPPGRVGVVPGGVAVVAAPARPAITPSEISINAAASGTVQRAVRAPGQFSEFCIIFCYLILRNRVPPKYLYYGNLIMHVWAFSC